MRSPYSLREDCIGRHQNMTDFGVDRFSRGKIGDK